MLDKVLGIVKGFKTDINLQDVAKPGQEGLKVLKKVERSDWASPIVCVTKKDGRIRICGDFKGSLSQVPHDNPYPDDLFVTLGSGTARLICQMHIS